jgi:hypothetical protein
MAVQYLDSQSHIVYKLQVKQMRRLALRLVLPCLITSFLLLPVSGLHAQDAGWPRTFHKPGGTLVLYQPQVDDWKQFQTVDARSALSITPTGSQEHIGVVTFSLQSTVNMDTHMVNLYSPTITGITFPSLDPATTAKMDALVRTFLNPSASMNISLDRLVASVKKKSAPAKLTAVVNDPPVIFISFKPAMILLVNGQPVLAPVGGDIKAVVNANWPLFQDTKTSTYYLFNGKGWMSATTIDGNWTATTQLPPDFSKVKASPNYPDLKPYIPAPVVPASPNVFYSSKPAEIIVFKGTPEWAAITGTQLLYASNTGSPIFKYVPTSTYYYLTSGRWFSSPDPAGPWTFATNSLPADFQKIPPSSPMGGVLASVPGTPQAEDAVLMAQVPTTAVINAAAAAKDVKVNYNGAPEWASITGTSMSYATNTPNKVIKTGDLYYMCFQGVWFMSTSPTGPWQTATSVPSEIYTIPPSSPVYNVTYVTQTTLPDGNVQSSYTAGYLGTFVTGMALGAIIADGTGYYYPPYVGWYGAYPAYYPYATTYGYHYAYNPYTGAYGYGASAYGPYGGQAHWGASYNPYTGTYARGATASTPYGSRTAAQAYNPYTGAYAQTRQGSNAYGSWGSSVYSKNGTTTYTQHESNAYGSEATAYNNKGGEAAATSTKYGSSAAAKSSSGDMYAAHDGNVYKNTGSGWQTYNNGSWNTVNKQTAEAAHPQGTADAQSYQQSHPDSSSYNKSGGWGDANQDAQARAQGADSSQRWSQAQHSGWGGDDGSGSHSGGGGWASRSGSGGWGGGGDHWGGGGGGFDRGGGGGFRR